MHREEIHETAASAEGDSGGGAKPTEIRLALIRAAKVQELEERAKEMSERLAKLVAEGMGDEAGSKAGEKD